MISTIALIGAVPFGYIREMNECEALNDHECPEAEGMAGYNLFNRTGLPPLPDVIVSNTPPSSPIRPAQAFTRQFPPKTSDESDALVTLSSSFTPCVSFISSRVVGGSSSLSRENDFIPGSYAREAQEETCPPSGLKLCEPLPQLLQEILPSQWCREEPHVMVNERGRGFEQKEENGREQRWRRVGGHLRMIADLFEANSAKGASKKTMATTLTVPASLTSCLSASVLWLIYWRFFKKFR